MNDKRFLNFTATAFAVVSCAVFQPVSAGADDLMDARMNRDWLIDPRPYRSEIKVTDDRIVLQNGLAQRIITLKPGAATVSLKCLTTQEEYVRGVTAEARVTFDGKEYPVGGLEGQEVLNYLRPEWIKGLSPFRGAYRYEGATVGEIKERFKWKKRPEWMAHDLPWPPKGKHLVMRYRPPSESASDKDPFGPEVFKWLPADGLTGIWRTVQSDKDARTSCCNEGFAGQIYVEKRQTAYMERDWPAGAVAVIAKVDCGTDVDGPAAASNELSTGLTVTTVGDDGIEVTSGIALSPARNRFFSVAGGAGLERVGPFDKTKEATLVAERRGDAWFVHAEQEGRRSAEVVIQCRGKPVRFQVGKIGASEGGGWKRLHVNAVSCRAAKPQSSGDRSLKLPDVDIHYEIYDGAPLISKWMVISNTTEKVVRVDNFVVDELRLCDASGVLDNEGERTPYNLYAECNYQYYYHWRGDAAAGVHYERDLSYTTQESWSLKGRNFLKIYPKDGVGIRLNPGEGMESCRAWELLFDSTERQRRGLAMQRMYRITCPWVTENPLFFHMTLSGMGALRGAVEQCKATGFEIMVMSFGSGFNHQSVDKAYRDKFRELSDYARERNVAIGGYSLTGLLHGHWTNPVPERDRAVNPSPTWGPAPCLASEWGRDYFKRIMSMMDTCGFGFFENDGPYPGYYCAATNHAYHVDKADSIWRQWRQQADCYRWCRANGVYVNQPDWYFFEGGSKACGGYRETNCSLPRSQQLLIERQNIYDNSWTTTPSMRWMFVPLSVYQGGGAAATIEPLGEHRDYYSKRFANLLGSGSQATWRGPRLYDDDKTLAMVRGWVDFYKRHRAALDGSLIHLRRADGRDWDGWLMVDPEIENDERAVASIFNPLPQTISRHIRLPLYYTGLRKAAWIAVDENGKYRKISLDPFGNAVIKVSIPAEDSIRIFVRRKNVRK